MSWKFPVPPEAVSITSMPVISGGELISHVNHGLEDGVWQFWGESGIDESNAVVVLMKEIVEADPTVEALHNLPPGAQAYRSNKIVPWILS